MTDRVLDISTVAAKLRVRNELLEIDIAGSVVETVPLCDLAVLIVAHRQVTFTQAVLCGLARAGAAFISCDEKLQPAAMMLPLEGHYAQTERFLRQAAISGPRRKRMWQAIVKAKVVTQGRLLVSVRGTDFGLIPMAARVQSGDPSNVEAQAARRYWLSLFCDPAFRRGDDEDVRNHLLNYGYAVVRAAANRALCASGLHPSFGLHHSNRHNPFVLADDLMEPFRPCVDAVVERLCRDERPSVVGALEKQRLIEAVTSRHMAGDESRTLFDWLLRTAQALARVIMGESDRIKVPEIDFR